jgi:CSLREA domain-containing protein
MFRLNLLPVFLLLVCLLALPGLAQPAQAGATFNVNTTADTVDSNPGDGICRDSSYACSLRAAIMEANALGGSSAHWIFLWPGRTHTLSLDTDGGGHAWDTGSAATDDLDITANIVIMGNFATIQRTGSCTIDGSAVTGEFRIFEVRSGGKLTLQDVTVRDGCADGAVQNGGGIAVQSGGELTVINSALTGHRASNKVVASTAMAR